MQVVLPEAEVGRRAREQAVLGEEGKAQVLAAEVERCLIVG